MSGDFNERFLRLIRTLALREIRPMRLRSENVGPMPVPGSELRLEWNQSFAEGDPLATAPDTLIFRPKYELNVSSGNTVIFTQESVFIIGFSVLDKPVFDVLWADEALRKFFMEKQIQKTLWPIFRQHALDGMSRLGIAPLPLPWIM